MHEYGRILQSGLWTNNTSLVQLIGLCPLLAVSGTVVNALGLGLATTLALICSSGLISLFRNLIPEAIRLPVFVLIIASSVTAVELLIKAFYYDLYLVLGIFIPLIVTNCALIGRAEAFAAKHSPDKALLDAFSIGMGFTLALMLLGGVRELLGYGTLFAQADLMFGPAATWLTITVFEHYRGWLLAVLPPGAFIGLAVLIALKNWLDKRLKKPFTAPAYPVNLAVSE